MKVFEFYCEDLERHIEVASEKEVSPELVQHMWVNGLEELDGVTMLSYLPEFDMELSDVTEIDLPDGKFTRELAYTDSVCFGGYKVSWQPQHPDYDIMRVLILKELLRLGLFDLAPFAVIDCKAFKVGERN